MLYVDDCAKAITKSVEIDTTPEPINIGTGSEITIKGLVTMMAKIMGYEGTISYNSEFPDGQPRRCLDTNRAFQTLEFEASTELYNGLKDTIDWYYKNKGKEKFCDYFDHIQ